MARIFSGKTQVFFAVALVLAPVGVLAA